VRGTGNASAVQFPKIRRAGPLLAPRSTARLLCLLCLLCLLAERPAGAALPDEIQVYVDDLNDPGRYSLQLHVNATPVGDEEPQYTGESVAAHGARLTAEFAYGLTPDLEAGAYLPVTYPADSGVRLAGFKLRLKWVPYRQPENGAGFFAGLNGEWSDVAYRFEAERRGFELRPILGWRGGPWLLAVNPVLDFALAGPERSQPPTAQPSFKVARTVDRGIAAGIEYYTDLGRTSGFEPWSEQQRTLYLALDVDRKPWNVNFGIGRGLTPATDRWTVKMIIDVPLGE